MVKVEWTAAAIADLSVIDKAIVKRIVDKIDWYAHNYEQLIPEQLSGSLKGLYKIRIGDWRVIYELKDDALIILYINHCSKIYK